jgi:hypothetical protein
MNDGRLITIICLMLLSPVATVNVNAVATAGIYLLKDADRVRQLLETNSCMGCDLREVNLEDAKLKGSLVIGHWSLVIGHSFTPSSSPSSPLPKTILDVPQQMDYYP